MFKHILVPTDGSPLSAAAVHAAVRLAAALGARVTGLFAAPPATPIVYRDALPVGYATPERHAKMIRRAARAHLAVIERAAQAAGVPCETLSVTSDYPAEAILETAGRRGCDLIFMASHSRRGLRGLLLGSQTQKVLAAAKLPVLVYRRSRADS
jgi:nucleotide-binding universal stress UspA family protein